MNIPNMIKQHRYETICAVLALLILLALWPASRLGSQARAKTKDLENWSGPVMIVDGYTSSTCLKQNNKGIYLLALADRYEPVRLGDAGFV